MPAIAEPIDRSTRDRPTADLAHDPDPPKASLTADARQKPSPSLNYDPTLFPPLQSNPVLSDWDGMNGVCQRDDCTSRATPCATISNAVSQANSGDTIYVSGTIDDHVTIATSLTIRQWPDHSQAVVDGTSTGTPFTINSSSDTSVTLERLTIQHGVSTYYGGGGINLEGNGSLTVSDSTVSNNTAGSSSSPAGGGIENDGGSLTVINSTISNNTASGFGGGIDNEGTLNLSDSTIWNNSSPNGYGGGLSIEGASTVTDSTFSGNSSGVGGGISVNQSTLTLVDSTVSANTATISGEGGGIFNPRSAQLGATIVAANSGGNCFGTFTSLGYNLTDDADGSSCGFTQSTDMVNANPNLGALANNGGPTPTMLPPNPSPEAFVIPNPTTLGTTQVCPRIDQRGVPSSGACTIGAVEAIPGVAPSMPSGDSHTWTTGQSGSLTVHATGTPPPTITHPYGQPGDGKLPNGLTLSTSPGSVTISGTPAVNAGGTYNIKLVADNGLSPSSTQDVTVYVVQAPVMAYPPPYATVAVEANNTFSQPWSLSAPATTWPHINPKPVTYSTDGLPPGTTFNDGGSGSGTITGTLAKGTYGPITITAANFVGTSSTSFYIKAQ